MLTLSSLVLSGYISMHGGVETVGIYQAGATIVVSYFAVIISAMSTEYYPRICGINDDDARLAQAVNAQSEAGLIIGLPLIVSLCISRSVFSPDSVFRRISQRFAIYRFRNNRLDSDYLFELYGYGIAG